MIKDRLKDWRFGAVVYQVMVDRFAPSQTLDEKKSLYAYPRQLVSFDTLPKATPFDPKTGYHTHELLFWGGDLKSLEDNLDYIKSLDVDVLYLNPIPKAVSNHKYDASDYLEISEEYGTKEDLKHLIDTVHKNNMKIMLDGVFNHMGKDAPMYIDAKKNPKSPYRNFFDFNASYPEGVRLWMNVKSLPELNLEEPKVLEYLYQSKNSVIQQYLTMGIDGWRLDVAFDIGYHYLKDITTYTKTVNPQAMIIGEVHNYPKDWAHAMDGVMNFTFRSLVIKLILGETTPYMISNMIKKVIEDTGIEPILRSWMMIDNHDMPRLTHVFNTFETQRLALVLLFSLPGSPNLYYGTELGMEGSGDPENRAPMAWHLNQYNNPYKQLVQELIQLRHRYPALKVGDYQSVLARELFVFIRKGDHISEDIYVCVNVSNTTTKDILLIEDSDLMNYAAFEVLSGEISHIHVTAGVMEVTMNPLSYAILRVKTEAINGYTPYKRIDKK